MTRATQIGQVEGDNPEEIKKQKAIKGLLNKITPEKFDKILGDIIAVGYDTEKTESGLIDQVWQSSATVCWSLVIQLLYPGPAVEAVLRVWSCGAQP